jgi:Ca2+-binding RTX toxin-like protein
VPSQPLTTGAQGNLDSNRASFSADGEWIVFDSLADNLVPGHGNYGPRDVFVKNLATGAIELVSRAGGPTGAQGNGDSSRASFTADGKKVVFVSDASNLVAGDTNGQQDVFIRNLETHTTTRVNLTSTGAQANDDTFDVVISPDGTKIVFSSFATNIVGGTDTNNAADIFLKDLVTGTITHLTDYAVRPGEGSRLPRFSPDGGIITWHTMLENLSSPGNYTEQYFRHVLPSIIEGNGGNNSRTGTARADTIKGLGGNDTLFGLGGGDSLDGGSGNDSMTGSQGDDIYVVDSTGDIVDENAPGSSGIDTVRASLDFTLASSKVKGRVENLALTGSRDLDGTGNDRANVLTGNSGDNVLKGGKGNDTIKGGAGKDTIDGGAGTDLADYSDRNKAIEVTLKSAGGTVKVDGKAEDTLKAVEGIIGSSRNDRITGDGGDNWLNGYTGKDTLRGGAGDDKFVFDTMFMASNVETIVDFKRGEDKIALDSLVFFELGVAVTADELGVKASGNQASGNQLLIYDKSSGKLWYDYDSTGPQAPVQLAVLTSKPSTLSAADFMIV